MARTEPPLGPLGARHTVVQGALRLSTERHALREIPIDRARMRMGRRPYNDVLLDDLTVSGEHALLVASDGQAVIHDLNSRNGTLVNGASVNRKRLQDGDLIEIGVYRLRYVSVAGAAGDTTTDTILPPRTQAQGARIEVVSGVQIGSVLHLDRPVVALDNRAGQMATIALRGGRYSITHMEGPAVPIVNGAPIGLAMHGLTHHDLIELGGTIYRFVLEDPV